MRSALLPALLERVEPDLVDTSDVLETGSMEKRKRRRFDREYRPRWCA
jgi:hypothetical protein